MASGGVSYLSSSSWINKLSLFTKFTSNFCFKYLCCFCVISGLSSFIGLVILIFHAWLFLACLIYHQLLNSRYALFSVMGWFSLILNTSYFRMENWQAWSSMDDFCPMAECFSLGSMPDRFAYRSLSFLVGCTRFCCVFECTWFCRVI